MKAEDKQLKCHIRKADIVRAGPGLHGEGDTMSEDQSEDIRDASANTAASAGWNCLVCGNEITYEDKEAFFATGKGLCSRCDHRRQHD
jgi:hypothetical protein